MKTVSILVWNFIQNILKFTIRYLPASIRSRARELLIPAYGVSPFENISHIKMPYDHTSHKDVYLPKFSASGAVHLIGICFIPSETAKKKKNNKKISSTHAPQCQSIVNASLTYVLFFFAGHSKVRNFNYIFITYQTVPCGQVTVDAIL